MGLRSRHVSDLPTTSSPTGSGLFLSLSAPVGPAALASDLESMPTAPRGEAEAKQEDECEQAQSRVSVGQSTCHLVNVVPEQPEG
jgi:hypothetical protein